MESIEKLRRMSHMFDTWHFDDEDVIEVRYCTGQSDFDSVGDRIRRLLDEAEAEIADRYMPLPLDADGVPIHPGDTVYAVDGGWRVEDTPLFLASNGLWAVCGRRPDELTHVKPRAIEDVLGDLVNLCYNTFGSSCMFERDKQDIIESGNFKDFVDEIRGMQ